MQTVANRVIELTPNGIIDRLMTFDEYLEDKRVKELRETMYQAKAPCWPKHGDFEKVL